LNSAIAVVGLGEVGRPIRRLLERAGLSVAAIDVDPPTLPEKGTVDVLHICYPFEIADFEGETARYLESLEPRLTVINSTVAVGTTRSIHNRTGAAIAHSPVRGKHVRMEEELLSYVKYVGATDPKVGAEVAAHFESIGMRTRVSSSPEATELAKLSETTYFGLQIAWAQQVERWVDRFGVDYDEVVSFYEEISFLPPKYFPGMIGGHCVMPNIEILERLGGTPLLDAIRTSNAQKQAREAQAESAAAPPLTASAARERDQ
jgi:UDP-N-acetyl-D-mannosaminuronate dehydrogenase